MSEINKLSLYISKYYSNEFSKQIEKALKNNYNEYMNNCFLYMQETRFFNYLFETNIRNENRINNLENHLNYIKTKYKNSNNMIDKIAWWIPVRKWRDKFRNKFNRTGQDRTGQDRTPIIFEYAYRKTA